MLAALKVLQEGHIARDKMLGSWAGAMGQPQFMPSNFLTLAVDFTGDGRKDIWGKRAGRAGVDRELPQALGLEGRARTGATRSSCRRAFDYRAQPRELCRMGRARRRARRRQAAAGDGNAILFFPSGAAGPAFLVGENFEVIKRYNNSDVFALAVSHLADRARGGAPFRARWPAIDRQLVARPNASRCRSG